MTALRLCYFPHKFWFPLSPALALSSCSVSRIAVLFIRPFIVSAVFSTGIFWKSRNLKALSDVFFRLVGWFYCIHLTRFRKMIFYSIKATSWCKDFEGEVKVGGCFRKTVILRKVLRRYDCILFWTLWHNLYWLLNCILFSLQTWKSWRWTMIILMKEF